MLAYVRVSCPPNVLMLAGLMLLMTGAVYEYRTLWVGGDWEATCDVEKRGQKHRNVVSSGKQGRSRAVAAKLPQVQWPDWFLDRLELCTRSQYECAR